MASVVNLRAARKARALAEKRAAADRNAAKHGLSKAAKAAARKLAERDRRTVDAHKREDDEG